MRFAAMWEKWLVACVELFWMRSWGAARRVQHDGSNEYALRMRVDALLGGLTMADPAVNTKPRGVTESTSRPADLFTAAAVPGGGAAFDVCVASSNAAAARGDFPQAAFERQTTHYRR